MRLPRWTWEIGTVLATGVLATLIAREMLRPPGPPEAPALAATATATGVVIPPANPPAWYDASLDPEALKRAYPTPFAPVPIEKQRNYRKLYPLTNTPDDISTTY